MTAASVGSKAHSCNNCAAHTPSRPLPSFTQVRCGIKEMDYIPSLSNPSKLFQVFHQSLHATKPLLQYSSLEVIPRLWMSSNPKPTSIADQYVPPSIINPPPLTQLQPIHKSPSRTGPLHPRTSSNKRHKNSLHPLPPLLHNPHLDRPNPLLPRHPPNPNIPRQSPPLQNPALPIHIRTFTQVGTRACVAAVEPPSTYRA
jgi:hypothetical protein